MGVALAEAQSLHLGIHGSIHVPLLQILPQERA